MEEKESSPFEISHGVNFSTAIMKRMVLQQTSMTFRGLLSYIFKK